MRSVPKLQDVANVAGVSTATVSRCLNSPDRVQEKTRRRVFEVIDELGYTPNFAAQVMAAKRTFTIGAVIPTMENAIFARGLQAFQEALHERGYTLLVASSAYRPDIEEEQVRKLVARGADGLLLIGEDRNEAVYDLLQSRNISAVIAWTYSPEARFPSVGFDNQEAMRSLTEHVLSLGHRNIAVISGVIEGNDRARLRLDGVRDALRAHDIEPSSLPVIETPYDIEGGGDAFSRLMALDPRPTAVLCGNDVLAVGAHKRARECGVPIPQEVSITGFDDIEIARIVDPELATVHVPHREMGRMAAKELIELVEGRSLGLSRKLATSICIRGSLGRSNS